MQKNAVSVVLSLLKFSPGVKFELIFIGEKSLLRALMVESNKFKS